MPTTLPRSAPTDQGVDPAAILRFLDALTANQIIEMHSFMLVRHGQVVAEGWWHPYSADRPHLLYSLSKSFAATAAAFAASEGLLDLDDTVVSYFPEFASEITDPGSRSMRVRHIASMASGHQQETNPRALALDPTEPVRGFLLIPPDRPPGTVFAYNQPCTYTLGSIVQRKAGMPLTRYLRPRLFDPLGIGPVGWQTLAGREQGFSGLHARTEDVAKLGQLYLQRGWWDGVRFISEDWIAQATSKQIDTSSQQQNPDWQQGYGFQFWMSRFGYRGDGAFGQFCVILPEYDAVLATTACTVDMQAILDAAWSQLIPGLRDGTIQASNTHAELEARLRTLALPAYEADAEPRNWSDWHSQQFTVAYRKTVPQAERTITSVRIERAGSDVRLTLNETANALSFALGTSGWHVSNPPDQFGKPIPVATSGGWTAPTRLHAEVIFLETPHRIDIECSLEDRCATAVWRLPPLGSCSLSALRMP